MLCVVRASQKVVTPRRGSGSTPRRSPKPRPPGPPSPWIAAGVGVSSPATPAVPPLPFAGSVNPSPSVISIDLGVLDRNVALLRAMVSKSAKFCAVLKNNAFGHGIGPVALAIARHVDMFGVVDNWEAKEIRSLGLQTPILRVRCASPDEVLESVEGVEEVLASYEAASLFSSIAVACGRVIKCHIFVNVGENRFCYNLPADLKDIVQSSLLPGIEVVGVMAHFACASELELTRSQLALFLQQAATVEDALSAALGRPVKLLRHTANTQAAISLPESHLDMVRIGGGLFGQEANVKPLGLRPAFTWTTCVSLVRRVPAGTSVGYGMAFTLSSGQLNTVRGVAFEYAQLTASGRCALRLQIRWWPRCQLGMATDSGGLVTGLVWSPALWRRLCNACPAVVAPPRARVCVQKDVVVVVGSVGNARRGDDQGRSVPHRRSHLVRSDHGSYAAVVQCCCCLALLLLFHCCRSSWLGTLLRFRWCRPTSVSVSQVDVTNVEPLTGFPVKIGDRVILMGTTSNSSTAEDLACRLGTSFDELTAGIVGASTEYITMSSPDPAAMSRPM